MLEGIALRYEVRLVSFDTTDQFTPEFKSLNPYGKIPAIIDPHGPSGKPLPLFESGAILLYLAEPRTGDPETELSPSTPTRWWRAAWRRCRRRRARP